MFLNAEFSESRRTRSPRCAGAANDEFREFANRLSRHTWGTLAIENYSRDLHIRILQRTAVNF